MDTCILYIFTYACIIHFYICIYVCVYMCICVCMHVCVSVDVVRVISLSRVSAPWGQGQFYFCPHVLAPTTWYLICNRHSMNEYWHVGPLWLCSSHNLAVLGHRLSAFLGYSRHLNSFSRPCISFLHSIFSVPSTGTNLIKATLLKTATHVNFCCCFQRKTYFQI